MSIHCHLKNTPNTVTLLLDNAPLFLRVVYDTVKKQWDALDKPGTTKKSMSSKGTAIFTAGLCANGTSHADGFSMQAILVTPLNLSGSCCQTMIVGTNG